MREAEFNPPAIVREAHDYASMVESLRARFQGLARRQREDLQTAIQVGKELTALKKICPPGKWLETIAKIGIPSSRSYRYMILARIPEPIVSGYSSIEEAIRGMRIIDREEAEIEEMPEPVVGADGKVEGPLCYNCRVYGEKNGCFDCDQLRGLTTHELKHHWAKVRLNPHHHKWFRWTEHERILSKVTQAPDLLSAINPTVKGIPEFEEVRALGVTFAAAWQRLSDKIRQVEKQTKLRRPSNAS